MLEDPQEFFKQYLIKNEEQTSYEKIYSMHFGEVSIIASKNEHRTPATYRIFAIISRPIQMRLILAKIR